MGISPCSCIPGALKPSKYAPRSFSLSGRQFKQLTARPQVHVRPIYSLDSLPLVDLPSHPNLLFMADNHAIQAT
jgi:hypothetical protein